MSRPDLLLVSLGTTRGLRVADAAFLEHVRAAGASATAVSVRVGALGRLRRAYPVIDAVEMLAARRATAGAIRRRPRAVVFSTVTAALLAPRLGLPYGVRLDSPAALNRPGLASAPLHALERRALRAARVVLPWSGAALVALPAGRERALVLPPPVTSSGPQAERRQRAAVAYVPDPKAKGLELLCAAWALAGLGAARLLVFGIEADRARAHLARTGVPEPDGVEWLGMAPAQEFRSALRGALAFVSAARWEDFGQAQLEALADGALLVTGPSGGAYEALALARELEPRLAAPSLDPGALADALCAAFELPGERLERYRAEAGERLAPYRPDALERRVREQVMPSLLG